MNQSDTDSINEEKVTICEYVYQKRDILCMNLGSFILGFIVHYIIEH